MITNSLLEVFDLIEVRNEEKISGDDLEHCRKHQTAVEDALKDLDKWYQIFYQASLPLRETHRVEFAANGTVTCSKPYKTRNFHTDDYGNHDFLPFDSLNKIVEKRRRTIEIFTVNIIRYFNDTYKLSVDFPRLEEEQFPVDFMPRYTDYVDLVIAHLGGRSFRETAEDELIRRVQNSVHRYNSHPLPEVKGKSIIFHNIVSFDNIHLQYHNKYRISWSESKSIETLCAGLAFYGQNRINGDTGIISGLNRDDVNISDCYPLSTSPAEYIKFYKNSRVDVKFSDAASAEDCFQKLKLHELITHNL
jgi:hypothetical protein